ncbi:MAG TPA: sterol desaturase family protein [Thermoanaerobaculia bacterium]|nr:sterol desaturase family protein [Thermoanaerobaculia bacterium]
MPTTLTTALAFLVLSWAERRWPLRRRVELQGPRLGRNLATAAMAAAATAIIQRPFIGKLARRVGEGRLGVLHQLKLPPAARTVLGVLLLDYTLWWWHRMNHETPLLWRFHLVHHLDLDLDVSTAVRFHFGEMALSGLFRAAQIRLIGADERALELWQRLLLVSILFHHANLRLPRDVDDALARMVVTPRMHGIHHSDVREETDSNWSSLLSWWDWLHRTMRLDVPQEAIEIGVPAFREADDLTLGEITRLPFRRALPDAWVTGGERRPS